MLYNISNKDFSLVEQEKGDLSDFYGVVLKTGKWQDVVVVYGKVGIKEDLETDTATLSFTYNIQDPADHDYDTLASNEDFNNYLGDVLQFIITDSLDNKDARIGHNESTTNPYTESSTQ